MDGEERAVGMTDPMPRHIVPMLATTANMPSRQSAYTFEVKWDGVRGISYIKDNRWHLESRNLRDITPRYPELEGLPAALDSHDVVLDGEVVAFDDNGKPSFGRLEVVIGGWLPGQGNRENRLGALLAGYYDDEGRLRYAGRVGTGFTDTELRRVAGLLAPLARETSPFADPVPAPRGMARWVEPRLVADVDFGEWTSDGTMRHPSYKGLRDDKEPSEVRREPI